MSHKFAMNPENKILLTPNTPDYPAALRRCSDNGQLLTVTAQGNLNVLDSTLLSFFCSVRAPGDTILKTYDLSRTLRDTDATIIGGFQSPMEKECLDLLLRGTAPVVVCPARGLSRMRTPKNWKKPLAEGRLLILSFFNGNIHRPTAAIAARRNAHIAALTDCILIAHAEPGGKTETLCKDALAQNKPVFVLDSPDNAHLIELGSIPIPAEEVCSAIQGKVIYREDINTPTIDEWKDLS